MVVGGRTLICLLLTGAVAVRHIDDAQDMAVALEGVMDQDCNSACDCKNFENPALSVQVKCKPCLETLGEHISHKNPFDKVRNSYCAPMACNSACDCVNIGSPALSVETECKPCLEKLGEHINHHRPLDKVRESYCSPMASTTTTTTAMSESTADCNSACDCENFGSPALNVEAECQPCLERLGEHINHHNPFDKVRDSYCAPPTKTTSIIASTTDTFTIIVTTGTTTETTSTNTETSTTTSVPTSTTTPTTGTTTTKTTTTTTTTTETTTTTRTTTTTKTITATTIANGRAATTTTSTSGARHLLISTLSLVASFMSLIMLN